MPFILIPKYWTIHFVNKLNPHISIIKTLFYFHDQIDTGPLVQLGHLKGNKFAIIGVRHNLGQKMEWFVIDKPVAEPFAKFTLSLSDLKDCQDRVCQYKDWERKKQRQGCSPRIYQLNPRGVEALNHEYDIEEKRKDNDLEARV